MKRSSEFIKMCVKETDGKTNKEKSKEKPLGPMKDGRGGKAKFKGIIKRSCSKQWKDLG